MSELTIHYRDIKTRVPIDQASSLLDAVIAAGIPLEGSCGGRGKCGQCVIEVVEGSVKDSNGNEAIPVKAGGNGYLACRSYTLGDLAIRVPELKASGGKLISGRQPRRKPDPILKRQTVVIEKPTIADPRSYQEAFLAVLDPGLKFGSLQGLADIGRSFDGKDGTATLFSHRGEIIHVESGASVGSVMGIAIDVGTTTIAAMLADLTTGRLAATDTEANPQAAYGADVISRIHRATTPAGLATLHNLVIDAVNGLIGRLCERARTSRERVYLVTVAGNTTMHHLFAGINPAALGMAPFVPIAKYFPPIKASDLGIQVHPTAIVEMLPVIGGFVGADTVAGIIAVDQDQSDEMTLLIDLGTNGEIVLGNKRGLIAASTAAGPAFEGVHITHGMRAVPGAIDRVSLKGKELIIHTIGKSAPRGICGSGLFDAMACLLRLGIIDPSGRITNSRENTSLPPAVRKRTEDTDKGRRFVLADAKESGTGSAIAVTQQDIREVQLAKGAIAAGITVLMEEQGIQAADIARVHLAGAFGNSVNRESVVYLGLIPGIPKERIFSVGNAAGYGALMALLSANELERANTVARNTRHLELATRKRFNEDFIRQLSFPKA
jgi:uncharacterized 2Fe-2S/4Fe-4S cluster protein (DUF4445 family)